MGGKLGLTGTIRINTPDRSLMSGNMALQLMCELLFGDEIDGWWLGADNGVIANSPSNRSHGFDKQGKALACKR
ncbi:hypothetical protein [Crenobacter cavernae]|uniref:hypothetical protein n=1 Tax=Crenobacter cavernae TaxID=2290923 RepID=UPI0011C025A7|nr:hypothetical protein [Crenobacter cavernae]